MSNRISVLIDVTVDRANNAIKGFQKSLKEADGAAAKFKAGVGSVGDTLKANIMPVAAAAGVAVASFAVKAIKSASDLDESANAVQKVFGDAADGVLKLGENADKAMGLSRSAFNGAAVSFSSFAKAAGGDVVKNIEALTQRAADFASVMNLDVTEAARVFQSALAGETEPIKKFGIDMSAAAVEAYALSNGLAKSKGEITESIKVQARYGLLLEQTANTAGDFADTSDGLANSQRIASARIENFQAVLGEKLIPTVELAVNAALDLADAMDKLGIEASITGERLGDKSFWEQVKSGAQDALNPVHALGTAYTEVSGLIDDATGSTDDNTRAVGDASRAITGHTASMKRGRKGALDAAKATEEATDATEDGTKAIEDHAKALKDQRDAQMAATDAILEAADSNLAYRNQAAKTTEAINANVAAQKDSKLSLEEKAQASRDAEGAAYDLAAAAVRQAQDEAAASGQTLTAAQSARIQKTELERVAAYMDGDAKAAIERYIAQLGRIPGDIYTNVRVNTRTGDLGPMQYGHRASGGPVAPGGAYVVGEQGPELLQMGSTGGNVVPNNKLGVGGGGGGNTINVYVRGGDPNEVIQAIQRYERRNGPGWRS